MSPYAPPRAILRVLSDDRLARHAASGSEQAFVVLYDRHARDLLATCRAIVRDEEDARDALQSTMLNAWRAIGRRGEAPVRPWLFRIARNEAITVLRRRRPSAELHEDAGLRPDLHEEAAGRADFAGVLDGLDDLTDRQREALVLRTLGDAPYDEIARMQDTSPQAVRQSVAHARRALRRRLAGILPMPAWLADLAASAGTSGAPAIQAGLTKTAVGVTAAVAVVGGAVGPTALPQRSHSRQATVAARTPPAGDAATPSAARAAVTPPAVAPALTGRVRDAAPAATPTKPSSPAGRTRADTTPSGAREPHPRVRSDDEGQADRTPGRAPRSGSSGDRRPDDAEPPRMAFRAPGPRRDGSAPDETADRAPSPADEPSAQPSTDPADVPAAAQPGAPTGDPAPAHTAPDGRG